MFLVGAKAYGPEGTKITIKNSDKTLNPNALDIGSFPQKFKQAIDMGKGSNLTVLAQTDKTVSKVVRVELEVITKSEVSG